MLKMTLEKIALHRKQLLLRIIGFFYFYHMNLFRIH